MRTIQRLNEMIAERMRFTLTEEEKLFIEQKYQEVAKVKMSKCPDCWARAIKVLAQANVTQEVQAQKPILVKDNLVVNEKPKTLEDYATGAGWYCFPDGYKVRGKNNAQKYFDEHLA
jgi:hypothetical protein